MRILIQRVKRASVTIDGKVNGEIKHGLLAFVGFCEGDKKEYILPMAQKLAGLRIFEDENEKMNLSVADVDGDILAISQFTLYADCSHGNRPSFTAAARPDTAKPLYDFFCKELEKNVRTERGIFGADMKVSLLNDGPFTVIIE